VFQTPEVQEYMEGCTRTRDVRKWVRNYLFRPPETQNAKEYKEECAGTRVSGNKSGYNCSGIRRHRNKWEGALGIGVSENGSGNIYRRLQQHNIHKNTWRSVQGLGCLETSLEICVLVLLDFTGTGIHGIIHKD
jgi:hypothetical protein